MIVADAVEQQFSVEVGRRLRAVRRQKGWSLDDVERESDGRWSASAVGAYERGYRNLSLPRLHELAAFYGVSMSLLLGEADTSERVPSGRRLLALDLTALAHAPEARPVARFAQVVQDQRLQREPLVLTVRGDDVRTLCSILDLGESELFDQLGEWGVLASDSRAGSVVDLVAAEREDAEADATVVDLRAAEADLDSHRLAHR